MNTNTYLVSYTSNRKGNGSCIYDATSGAEALGKFHENMQRKCAYAASEYRVLGLNELHPIERSVVARLDVPPGPTPVIAIQPPRRIPSYMPAPGQGVFPGMLVQNRPY